MRGMSYPAEINPALLIGGLYRLESGISFKNTRGLIFPPITIRERAGEMPKGWEITSRTGTDYPNPQDTPGGFVVYTHLYKKLYKLVYLARQQAN